MTVRVAKGDLFDSNFNFQAMGHGVNCHGVMGAGIAKTFRAHHPEMYKHYAMQCRLSLIQPGDSWLWKPGRVFNIASQDLPGPDASAKWLAQGLYRTLDQMRSLGWTRLGLPWIGCGIGGLTKEVVQPIMIDMGNLFREIDITIVEL
jgi:O-acetyl-ADP-ribose deacetylase (regulator of RNase III)